MLLIFNIKIIIDKSDSNVFLCIGYKRMPRQIYFGRFITCEKLGLAGGRLKLKFPKSGN